MKRVPKAKQRSTAPTNDVATVGYAARLWHMAAAQRGSMDAAEYKHVARGRIFLKSLSNAFEATQGALLAKMPLAVCGIDAQSGHGDTFSPDRKADFLLACGA